MIKLKYISIILVAALLWIASCKPEYKDLATFNAPDSTKLDFTQAVVDDYHYKFTNTSSLTGIASWNLGNGNKATGETATAYYPLPGTYTISLSVFTKGGFATKSVKLTTTKTDYSIFNDPKYISLSGGPSVAAGKTWVLDSLTKGHLGVGADGGTGLEWWSADPLAKKGNTINMYDDEINFKTNGFAVVLTNHGKSYVKDGVRTDAAYSNQVQNDVDYTVNFTPVPGTWILADKSGVTYLQMTCPKPLFPCFDVGAVNKEYKILTLTDTKLELVAKGFDNNAWHYFLIPKGYVKPEPVFDLAVTAATGENFYDVKLANVTFPGGATITKVKVDYADGTAAVEATDYTTVFNHQFIHKGNYSITVSVTTGLGTVLTKSFLCTVANNISTYVPYLLNAMITYNDFGETMLASLTGESGNSVVTVTANPNNKLYPDRSAYCAKIVKSNSQYDGARITLPLGRRFDLTLQTTFKVLVYGTAGDKLMLNLINTDKGGDAWKTGTADFDYTIKKSNTWEIATYNLSGVGNSPWGGDPSIITGDVTTDARYNKDFFNVLRLTVNNGNGTGSFTIYVDDIAGPHVEGLK